jgi:hypothetical protein
MLNWYGYVLCTEIGGGLGEYWYGRQKEEKEEEGQKWSGKVKWKERWSRRI